MKAVDQDPGIESNVETNVDHLLGFLEATESRLQYFQYLNTQVGDSAIPRVYNLLFRSELAQAVAYADVEIQSQGGLRLSWVDEESDATHEGVIVGCQDFDAAASEWHLVVVTPQEGQANISLSASLLRACIL